MTNHEHPSESESERDQPELTNLTDLSHVLTRKVFHMSKLIGKLLDAGKITISELEGATPADLDDMSPELRQARQELFELLQQSDVLKLLHPNENGMPPPDISPPPETPQ